MPAIRANPVKDKLRQGQPATCISGLMTSEIIDFLGPLGFDSVWMECEHGPVDWETLGDMTRACDLWGMASITRCNANDAALITRTLDRGSMGVVLPHVNTREEAEAAVGASKFAPLGYRGMFGGRQSFGVPDYVHQANDQTMVVVLIEEVTALDNLDEILKVDGIDVFFVAPTDLSQTMGHIGNVGHPRSSVCHRRRPGPDRERGPHRRHAGQRRQRGVLRGERRPVPDDIVERLGRQRRQRVPGADTLTVMPCCRGGFQTRPLRFRFRCDASAHCVALAMARVAGSPPWSTSQSHRSAWKPDRLSSRVLMKLRTPRPWNLPRRVQTPMLADGNRWSRRTTARRSWSSGCRVKSLTMAMPMPMAT